MFFAKHIGGDSMDYGRYRKHPRIYKKSVPEEEQRTLSLSAAAAAGILTLAFLKGMFWGYLIKKRMG